MIVSLLVFQIITWGNMILSALLTCTVLGIFIYELRKREIW